MKNIFVGFILGVLITVGVFLFKEADAPAVDESVNTKTEVTGDTDTKSPRSNTNENTIWNEFDGEIGI